MTYREFLRSNIDLSPVGLISRDTDSGYFCTPIGAKIIGWAGVDGIHYCFVKGFGETVFAVSPMNGPGEYVHPIAGCWDDLLQMLLTCGDLAALEQAHQWTRAQFDAFLAGNPPTPEQRRTLDAIREYTGLEPIDDPYDYVREVQANTDCTGLRFPEEYEEAVPSEADNAWAVTYDGNFWGQHGEPGEEILIQKRFHWDGLLWYIPAVYNCRDGLVVDLCTRVEPEKIKTFFDKWYPAISETPRLSEDVRRQVEQDNPLTLPGFYGIASVNGERIRQSHCCRVCWIPASALPDTVENSEEAENILSHYALDGTQGWVFTRACFPWEAYSGLFSLELTLAQNPRTIYGTCFSTPEMGTQISFTHPVFGTEHTLTVTATERGQMENMHEIDASLDFPTHYTSFTYQLSPDLSNRQFAVRDTVQSDEPRRKKDVPSPFTDAACIGIIGGADGPTAIFLSAKNEPQTHGAVSALHFEPVKDVLWQMEFHEKLAEDISVALI